MPPDKRYESKSTFTTTNNSGAKNKKKKKGKILEIRGKLNQNRDHRKWEGDPEIKAGEEEAVHVPEMKDKERHLARFPDIFKKL